MLNLFPLELWRPRINSLSLFLKLDSFNKYSELHCVEQVPLLVFKYRCSLLPWNHQTKTYLSVFDNEEQTLAW